MEQQFYQSIKDELLNNILPYWEKYSRDTRPGYEGFFGSINNKNRPNRRIPRSIVMTSRFLWAYSAAARLTKNKDYLSMADFAYNVISSVYFDKNNGGVYWSVKPDGTPFVEKKQIYGEAFCCYGLSEYAAAIKELKKDSKELSEAAMEKALSLFNLIEKYALDPKKGGYIEACAPDWKPTSDMQLSPKDMNCPKSMNTNLHVMEAYTNLYRTLPIVFGSSKSAELSALKNALTNLVRVTVQSILQKNYHLGMFFDMDWKLLDTEISYGHDIEASWLLWEAACELKDEQLKDQIRETVLKMAQVALDEGVDKNTGALENFSKGQKRDRTRIWWNQAEGLNGFYNAWEMTKSPQFADAVRSQWNWIVNHQSDRTGGEWWAAIDPNGNPLRDSKGGNWKTAYHSARACMELLRRSKTL